MQSQPQTSTNHLLEMGLTGYVVKCGTPDVLSRILTPSCWMLSQSSQDCGSRGTCLACHWLLSLCSLMGGY